MTISNQTNRSGPYLGNGVTTVFPYTFSIDAASHIAVIKRAASGAETIMTLGVHYTVSGVGAPGGGNVTMTTPPATGEAVAFLINIPFTQELDLENQGAYFAEAVEGALDLAVRRDQQLAEQINRAIKLPPSMGGAGGELSGELANNIMRLAPSADNIDQLAGVSDGIGIIASNITDIKNFGDVYLGAKAADPGTRNDSTALQAGDLYFNTSANQMKAFDGFAWRATSDASLSMIANQFAGTGSQTQFTLGAVPLVSENVIVFVGNALMTPTLDYTVAGALLTFATAPASGVTIHTRVVLTTAVLGAPAISSVVAASITTDPAEQALIRTKIGVPDASVMKWLSRGIGELYQVDDTMVGVDVPPTDDANFRFIKLTAGLTGAGKYNEGVLTTETVSGTDPAVVATAVINLAGSPLNGKTIRLLNSERRFLRAGAGALEDSAFGSHGHGVTDPGHNHTISDPGHAHSVYDPGHNHYVNDPGHAHSFPYNAQGQGAGPYNGSGGGGSNVLFGATNGAGTGIWLSASGTGIGIYGAGTGISVGSRATGISINSAGSNETRPRYAGISYYMRIA